MHASAHPSAECPPRRQVPVPLALGKLGAIMADEAKRTNPRDMILKSIEESLPKGVSSDAGEVLKQAVELHALVIIVDIRTEADLEPLRSKPVMEELLTNQVPLSATECH